jgi:hypothetical protein
VSPESSTAPETNTDPVRLSAWNAVLDRMETDLAQAEAADASTPSWHPPRGIGSLPPELGERARAILLAQTTTLARMQSEHTTIARHTAAIESIPTRRGGRRPVYLDHSA